jgi:hypothetical protein
MAARPGARLFLVVSRIAGSRPSINVVATQIAIVRAASRPSIGTLFKPQGAL